MKNILSFTYVSRASLLAKLGFRESYTNSIFFSKIKEMDYGTEIIEARLAEEDISWVIRWNPSGNKHPPYDREVSFQEIFESLTPDQKDIAIFNLEILS